jgi:hypothetical protein
MLVRWREQASFKTEAFLRKRKKQRRARRRVGLSFPADPNTFQSLWDVSLTMNEPLGESI